MLPPFDVGWGSAPDPAGGAHGTPQTPSWILGVLLLSAERGERRGREKECRGKEGVVGGGRGRGREGKGREDPLDLLPRKNFLATPLVEHSLAYA